MNSVSLEDVLLTDGLLCGEIFQHLSLPDRLSAACICRITRTIARMFFLEEFRKTQDLDVVPVLVHLFRSDQPGSSETQRPPTYEFIDSMDSIFYLLIDIIREFNSTQLEEEQIHIPETISSFAYFVLRSISPKFSGAIYTRYQSQSPDPEKLFRLMYISSVGYMKCISEENSKALISGYVSGIALTKYDCVENGNFPETRRDWRTYMEYINFGELIFGQAFSDFRLYAKATPIILVTVLIRLLLLNKVLFYSKGVVGYIMNMTGDICFRYMKDYVKLRCLPGPTMVALRNLRDLILSKFPPISFSEKKSGGRDRLIDMDNRIWLFKFLMTTPTKGFKSKVEDLQPYLLTFPRLKQNLPSKELTISIHFSSYLSRTWLLTIAQSIIQTNERDRAGFRFSERLTSLVWWIKNCGSPSVLDDIGHQLKIDDRLKIAWNLPLIDDRECAGQIITALTTKISSRERIRVLCLYIYRILKIDGVNFFDNIISKHCAEIVGSLFNVYCGYSSVIPYIKLLNQEKLPEEDEDEEIEHPYPAKWLFRMAMKALNSYHSHIFDVSSQILSLESKRAFYDFLLVTPEKMSTTPKFVRAFKGKSKNRRPTKRRKIEK